MVWEERFSSTQHSNQVSEGGFKDMDKLSPESLHHSPPLLSRSVGAALKIEEHLVFPHDPFPLRLAEEFVVGRNNISYVSPKLEKWFLEDGCVESPTSGENQLVCQKTNVLLPVIDTYRSSVSMRNVLQVMKHFDNKESEFSVCFFVWDPLGVLRNIDITKDAKRQWEIRAEIVERDNRICSGTLVISRF